MGFAANVLNASNGIIPKRDLILFNSFPDLSGNALALYEYILRERPDLCRKYQLVWTTAYTSPEEAVRILNKRNPGKEHTVIGKKSPAGILKFLTAKYLISTHYYFPTLKTSAGQLNANLWHGMPFKRIGRMLGEEEAEKTAEYADLTVSTSAVFRDLMARSFELAPEKVLVSGQPCNDLFFCDAKAFRTVIPDAAKYAKTLVWLPTYRKSVVGEIRQDGKADSFGVAEVLLEHFAELDECLRRCSALLLIKPHPMDAIGTMSFPESENIRIVTNADLAKESVQLYEFLAGCDVLLTDYSSVFIDFLSTGKPMAFVCDDISDYGSSRGFCFDPPRDYMPGELIENIEQLLDYLGNLDAVNQRWLPKYREIRELFNPFCDANSAMRVCDAIWGPMPSAQETA